jgi:hypothetical protein
MKTREASLSLFATALLAAIGAAGCTDDSAQPDPGACTSLLSPKTATICTGTSLILTLTGGPPAGSDIAWESDFGMLAYADDKGVFTAPSSGPGTTRIRVRWPGPCDLTSYVAYEPCDGGADGAANADASEGGSADADASGGGPADADASEGDDGAAGADAGQDGLDDAVADAPDAG